MCRSHKQDVKLEFPTLFFTAASVKRNNLFVCTCACKSSHRLHSAKKKGVQKLLSTHQLEMSHLQEKERKREEEHISAKIKAECIISPKKKVTPNSDTTAQGDGN